MTDLTLALLGFAFMAITIAPVAPHIIPTIYTLVTLSIPMEAPR